MESEREVRLAFLVCLAGYLADSMWIVVRWAFECLVHSNHQVGDDEFV